MGDRNKRRADLEIVEHSGESRKYTIRPSSGLVQIVDDISVEMTGRGRVEKGREVILNFNYPDAYTVYYSMFRK